MDLMFHATSNQVIDMVNGPGRHLSLQCVLNMQSRPRCLAFYSAFVVVLRETAVSMMSSVPDAPFVHSETYNRVVVTCLMYIESGNAQRTQHSRTSINQYTHYM